MLMNNLEEVREKYQQEVKQYWNEEYDCLEECIEFADIEGVTDKIYKDKLPEIKT